MITKLTAAQEKRRVQYHAEILAAGMSTQPADRPRAQAAITSMYEAIGEKPPAFLWCDSPATCLLAIHALNKLGKKGLSSLESSLGSSLESSLRLSLESSLWSSLGLSLESSLRSSLRSSLESSLRSSLGSSLRSSLWSSLWSSLQSSLESSLRSSLGSSLRSSLRLSLESSLWSSLRSSLRLSLGSSLRSSLESSLRSSLWSSLWSSLQSSGIEISYHWWGQHELSWIAFYKFCEEIGVKYDLEKSTYLRLWNEVGESAGWWWGYKGLVVISERPSEVHMEPTGRNGEMRLHNPNGPAMLFRDGWRVNAVHGVRLPLDFFETELSAQKIRDEKNAEVRRVMLDRYGAARYLHESKAKKLDHSRFGTLYEIELPGDVEPLRMVEVINSTPEPDGTRKHYTLRVDPKCKTALEAVAWTFGTDTKTYERELVHET